MFSSMKLGSGSGSGGGTILFFFGIGGGGVSTGLTTATGGTADVFSVPGGLAAASGAAGFWTSGAAGAGDATTGFGACACC
jgi:hypothetical protein